MASRPTPERKYRLHNGTMGTEWEACRETLATLEARRRLLDEEIELLQKQMELAEGRPTE